MPVTQYVWDPVTSAYLQEQDGSGNVVATYAQKPQPYGGLVSQRRGSATRYYLQDGQGSTRQLVDESGTVTDQYTYTAYGETVAQSGSTEKPVPVAGERGVLLRPGDRRLLRPRQELLTQARTVDER